MHGQIPTPEGDTIHTAELDDGTLVRVEAIRSGLGVAPSDYDCTVLLPGEESWKPITVGGRPADYLKCSDDPEVLESVSDAARSFAWDEVERGE